MRTSSKITGVAIAALAIVATVIWSAVYSLDRRGTLAVSFLNAGKGSAILIQAPSGKVALVDAGPDASILRALSARLPWWQRHIDVLILAHDDANHAGGLIDVLQRYQVDRVFLSGAPSSKEIASALGSAQKAGIVSIIAHRGQIIDLGSGASIEILFPDRDLSSAKSSASCIEMRLAYGATSFVLSCGSVPLEEYLAVLDGKQLASDVLYTSGATTSPLFAGFVGAQVVAQPADSWVSDGHSVRKMY